MKKIIFFALSLIFLGCVAKSKVKIDDNVSNYIVPEKKFTVKVMLVYDKMTLKDANDLERRVLSSFYDANDIRFNITQDSKPDTVEGTRF